MLSPKGLYDAYESMTCDPWTFLLKYIYAFLIGSKNMGELTQNTTTGVLACIESQRVKFKQGTTR